MFGVTYVWCNLCLVYILTVSERLHVDIVCGVFCCSMHGTEYGVPRRRRKNSNLNKKIPNQLLKVLVFLIY